jgi:prophage regulatory protein
MQLINKVEAARRASLSVSTLKRLEAEGDFPRKVPISANRVGYLVSEIDTWIAERVAERDEWLEAEHEAARPAEPERAPVWK